MMKRVLPLLAFLFLMLSGLPSHGQARKDKGIYIELLGASNAIGVNYDARFARGASSGWGWRAGLGFGFAYSSNFLSFSIADDKADFYNRMLRLSVPVEVNHLAGQGKSKFESGGGAMFLLDRYTSDTGSSPKTTYALAPYVGLGYRLVTDRGFIFRAGALPSYNFDSGKFGFWPYLSFGWCL